MYVYISLDLFKLFVASGSSVNAVESDDEDDNALSVPAAVGVTFVVTLVITVIIMLVIVYIVYKIKKKPATDEARVAFHNRLITDRESTIKTPKSSCDDENYEFPDNMGQAASASRYQSKPGTTMQSNPAYGIPQSADAIYENVN